jgi:hypothetical protein
MPPIPLASASTTESAYPTPLGAIASLSMALGATQNGMTDLVVIATRPEAEEAISGCVHAGDCFPSAWLRTPPRYSAGVAHAPLGASGQASQ